MFENEENRINRLEKKLYSRNYTPEVGKRSSFDEAKQNAHVETAWKPDTPTGSIEEKPKRKSSFAVWLLIASIAFFVVALGTVFFVVISGSSVISEQNVDVRVLGPVSVSAGEELSIDVLVDNKNTVDLESVSVRVEYPTGTRAPGNLQDEHARAVESYGEIRSGTSGKRTFKSILFGEQDEVKQIKIVVEYRVRGSNAIFTKEKTYDIALSSTPVILTVDYPGEVDANKDIEFVATVASNTNVPLHNLLLRAEYPFGFLYSSATPEPSSENYIWNVGTLEPEAKKTFRIRGTVAAQDNEERTFRFRVGLQSGTNEREISTDYAIFRPTVVIKQTDLNVRTAINGSQDQVYAANQGESIQFGINWINNLSTRIVNGKVRATIEQGYFNRSSVESDTSGFFRSTDNTVIWDQSSNSSLVEIPPGASGSASFGFTLSDIPLDREKTLRNPQFNIDVVVEGTRFSGDNVPEQVQTSVRKTIKLSSDINLSSRIVHSVGPLQNSGPIPPRVEEDTTYTVIWTLSNTFNDVSNVRVAAQLPPYVDWVGLVSPENEKITYDKNTRNIIWNASAVKAGVGIASAPRQVAFQIVFTPSVSQVGTEPILVREAKLSGTDMFTSEVLSDSVAAMTTVLGTDPEFGTGDGRVAQ